MLEDDDKVRRNLVVVSFAILLYFWLELPSGLLISRVFGVEAKIQLSEWKIWALLCAIIIYQVHRFYAVSVSSTKWEKAVERFAKEKVKLIRSAVQRDLYRLVTSENGTSSVLIDHNDAEILREASVEEDQRIKGHLNINNWSYEKGFVWEGHFGVEAIQYEPVSGKKMHFIFSVPINLRWRFDFWTCLKLIWSEFSSEFAFPIAIAYCALWGSANALVRSLV